MPKMDETTTGSVRGGGCELASYFRMPNQKQGPTSTVSPPPPSISSSIYSVYFQIVVSQSKPLPEQNPVVPSSVFIPMNGNFIMIIFQNNFIHFRCSISTGRSDDSKIGWRIIKGAEFREWKVKADGWSHCSHNDNADQKQCIWLNGWMDGFDRQIERGKMA